MIDALVGGLINMKTLEKALEPIEVVASNDYLTLYERGPMKKGVIELDIVNAF